MEHSSHPDAIVIGGGLIGSSIALRLAQAGLRVSVLDRGEPGAEASSAAAGMIAPQGEKPGFEPFAELCWASHALYHQFVAEIEQLSGQETGYRQGGTLLAALDEDQARELDEIAAAQARPGAGVERLSPAAAGRRLPGPSPAILSALFLPADQWLDNERLTAGVIEAARRAGVAFLRQEAVGLEVREGRMISVATPQERLSAAEFILAAGCWSGALAATAGLEIPTVPCRGQMLEFELESDLPQVLRAGHHYLVPRGRGRVIVGTTAEYAGFEKAVTAGGLGSVLQAALRLAPFLAEGRFVRAWAGLRPDTADHLPVLGRSGIKGLTLATGHFRNGILLAPITARLIADLVVSGAGAPMLDPFRAERFPLAATVS